MATDLPVTVVFAEPPFGTILSRKGQLGYKQDTRVRLRMDKQRNIYFPVKGRQYKYVQDKDDERTFRLVAVQEETPKN